MAWFKCAIRGENFPGALCGVPGLAGFYTTRMVEAADANDAEDRAVADLRADPRLAPPPGYTPAGIARVFIEEITELPVPPPSVQQAGFVWHPAEAGS